MYDPKPADLARNANNFVFHPPLPGQRERYERVRELLRQTADELLTLAPGSRELSVALTKLEEAMYWANAAIARNEKG